MEQQPKDIFKISSGAANTNTSPTRPPKPDKPEYETSPYFRVDVHSTDVMTIQFKSRSGSLNFFPYADRPKVKYIPDKGIFVETDETRIHITGSNLEVLAEWIGMYRVTWIRESDTGYAPKTGNVFVKDISITKRT